MVRGQPVRRRESRGVAARKNCGCEMLRFCAQRERQKYHHARVFSPRRPAPATVAALCVALLCAGVDGEKPPADYDDLWSAREFSDCRSPWRASEASPPGVFSASAAVFQVAPV